MNSHRRHTRKSRRRARAALLDSRAVRKHQSLTGRKGSVQERKPPSKKALGLRSTVQAQMLQTAKQAQTTAKLATRNTKRIQIRATLQNNNRAAHCVHAKLNG
jgi:hypothetical protein